MEDPFAYITKLCQPTASQEAKLRNCPFARESEIFPGSDSDQSTSSPDPMPSEPDPIVMVSLPASISSVPQQPEDDAVFHTPPEHHLPSYFSAEDQTLDDSSSDGTGNDRSKIARVREGGLDDKLDSKKIRVTCDEFAGETAPAGETEPIVDDNPNSKKIRVNERLDGKKNRVTGDEFGLETAPAGETEPIGDDNPNSKKIRVTESNKIRVTGDEFGCETAAADETELIGDDRLDSEKIRVTGDGFGLETSPAGETEPIRDYRLDTKKSRVAERLDSKKIRVTGDEFGCETAPAGETEPILDEFQGNKVIILDSMDSGEGNMGNGIDRNHNSGKTCESTEDIQLNNKGKRPLLEDKVTKDGKIPKNGVEKIDAFRYVSGGDGERRTSKKGRDGGRRRLPESLAGKGKKVETTSSSSCKSGLLEFLDILKIVFGGDGEDGGGEEDVDFLETAKRRGLTFPRPRWWPDE